MSRGVMAWGAVLLLAGLSLFAYKTMALGLPVVPSDVDHLWGVELEVTARGIGGLGSVRATLPRSAPERPIFDERSASAGLGFDVREEGDERIGIWAGRFAGTVHLVHGFRVELPPLTTQLPTGAVEPAPVEIVDAYQRSTALYPSKAFEVEDLLETLDLPPVSDPVARVRVLLAFVAEEVALSPEGSDDALLTLGAREGSAAGRVRLLVTLMRAAEVPARLALGLQLLHDRPPRRVLWAEAWLGDGWHPVSPARGTLGSVASDHLVLGYDRIEPLESTGVEAVSHRYRAMRERLQADEVAAMMTPDNPILARVSLYGLPFGVQDLLRLLLLMPLGALVTAVYRNLVGVQTLGTFMPILLALALRESTLGVGLAMIAAVTSFGLGGRLLLGRLHLLLVPRLSILLCLVVLTLVGLALAGRDLEIRDLGWGVLLPIVILTMLIERISVSLVEEGARNTSVKLFWSGVVTLSAYPIFQSELAAHLMFGYPELVVAVMGLLVWIGGYTGYRLSELVRFRSILLGGEAARP
jgi:hypothetical protein